MNTVTRHVRIASNPNNDTCPTIRPIRREEKEKHFICWPSIVGAGRSQCINVPKFMVEMDGKRYALCGVHAANWKKVWAYGEDPKLTA